MKRGDTGSRREHHGVTGAPRRATSSLVSPSGGGGSGGGPLCKFSLSPESTIPAPFLPPSLPSSLSLSPPPSLSLSLFLPLYLYLSVPPRRRFWMTLRVREVDSERRVARPRRTAGVAMPPPPSARFNLRLQSASIRSIVIVAGLRS